MKNAGISRRSIVLAAAGVSFAGAAYAQPGSQVVKILVGFPPGQATDIVARLLATKLPAVTGGNYIVDNKPGQGGSLAMGVLAKSPPDGSVLV
ncbi:tripartite tricarboxylate transporter substrate-binding protein [Variovorax rhizosphaerae]|uniref:Tripartite tricarboxylate transporter substrate-binding protein n=1 Tax=Variovorax rhizosphaerae TaxID=1836200 RepID=A0ABU8WXK1_9BURK